MHGVLLNTRASCAWGVRESYPNLVRVGLPSIGRAFADDGKRGDTLQGTTLYHVVVAAVVVVSRKNAAFEDGHSCTVLVLVLVGLMTSNFVKPPETRVLVHKFKVTVRDCINGRPGPAGDRVEILYWHSISTEVYRTQEHNHAHDACATQGEQNKTNSVTVNSTCNHV